MNEGTEPRHKVLLVDDDPAILELYRELLSKLPSNPEILTTNSGARALTLLEEHNFRLMICDLKMPKIDGLQVLAIVRRRFPMVRTVAMTAEVDEQFRSRAYALGVDLFWHKPATEQEVQMFLECLESLLGVDNETGFRGVQSKSLMDLLQLECMSQNSLVLRITNGALTGRVWIQDGDITDAETGEATAETAFLKILGWKNGTFETMAAEPTRPRTILKPYNALLLESAQALDEAAAQVEPEELPSPVAKAARHEGVEFVLAFGSKSNRELEARGFTGDAKEVAKWANRTLTRFEKLSDTLQAGPVQQFDGRSSQRQVTVSRQGDIDLCIGWKSTLSQEHIRELEKKVLPLWAS